MSRCGLDKACGVNCSIYDALRFIVMFASRSASILENLSDSIFFF